MLTDHQHFEELCALVAAGQASEDHLLKWREHSQGCAECRGLRWDFEQTARAIVVSDYKRAPRHAVPAGMTERFIAHARSAGVPLSRIEGNKRSKIPIFRRLAFSAALAAALIAVVAFFALPLLKRNVAFNSPPQKLSAADFVGNSILLQETSRLEGQLREAQAESRLLVARLKDTRQAFESAERKRLEIGTRLDELQSNNASLQESGKDRAKEIAQLRNRMEWVNSQRASAGLATDIQRQQLKMLQGKVEELSFELTEAQQLNAAANEAKDLIVARNLHIVDVHDNANGSKPRPFGRIFYTEGKKLVFYAYDLGDPRKLSSKVSFYVWGEKSGSAQQAKNLGILQADDERDGRWVVTFDNPLVLGQINTVFVTKESNQKTAIKPNGNRILVAFLDGEANHP